MKLLFTGVYKDGTGWGNSALEFIKALCTTDIDLVLRPIKLNDTQVDLPNEILELEKKDLNNVDVCIQNILPQHMEYTSKCKNIGLIYVESDTVKYSGWSSHLNLMDEVWVTSDFAVDICERDLSTLVKKVCVPVDLEKCSKYYNPIQSYELQNNFIFYFIGEFSRRKNISALIKAFHTEFSPSEPVSLLIKTNGNHADINKFCLEIKNGLRLYKDIEFYKKELIISNFLIEEELMRVHSTGDCIVMPSYGEGWSIPVAEAQAMGKPAIVSNFGGVTEYITDETGWLVDAPLSPAFGIFDQIPNLHTGFEKFGSIDIHKLGKTMREAYENRELTKKKGEAAKENMKKYSYEEVGRTIKNVLSL